MTNSGGYIILLRQKIKQYHDTRNKIIPKSIDYSIATPSFFELLFCIS